jgi:hypothetical protein
MLGSKRNRHECMYGCCRKINYNGKLFGKKQENRLFRARERATLRKEVW